MKNQDKNTRKFKKGFQITIRNLDTGEVLVNSKTRAIVGAYHSGDNVGTISVKGIGLTCCGADIIVHTIETAEKSVKEMKRQIVSNIPVEDFLAMLFGGKDE